MTDPLKTPDQDPLPESSWTWRRLFTFVMSGVLLYFVWYFAGEIAEFAKATNSDRAIDNLTQIIRFCIYLIALGQLYYLIAPSAEIMSKIFQAAASMRSGVSFRQEDQRPPRSRGWFGRRRQAPPPPPQPDREIDTAIDPENQPPSR